MRSAFRQRRVRRWVVQPWACLALALVGGESAAQTPPAATPAAARTALSQLLFEENVGQFDPAFRFVARTPDMGIGVGANSLRIVGSGPRRGLTFDLRFDGARHDARVVPEATAGRLVHHLRGADASAWVTGARTFESVVIEGLYDGVDVRVYANDAGECEFDFIVGAHVDPGVIALRVLGEAPVRVGEDGALVVGDGPSFLIKKPFAYQDTGAGRRQVDARYDLANGHVALVLGPHDADLPLVVDPVVTYRQELTGSLAERAFALAVDDSGHMYVAGETWSSDLFQNGTIQAAPGGARDAFVAKLSSDGTAVVFATYLGGSADDTAHALALDGSSIFVAGETSSAGFPRVGGPQPTCASCPSQPDGFVSRLSLDGSALLFSTFLGGAGADVVRAAVVDGVGGVHITGETSSADFPATGARSGPGGGTDAFVARLSATGGLVRSLVLGGAHADRARALAIAPDGAAVIAGDTASADFPVTQAIDATLSESAWFVSTDAGATWVGQHRPGAPRQGVLYTDTPSNYLYVLDHQGTRLWRSADGGVTWTLKTSVDAIALGAGGRVYALYLPNGFEGPVVIESSSDYGATWTTAVSDMFLDATCSSSFCGVPSRLVADPVQPDTVFAYGQFDVWRSTNGGQSWAKILNNYECLSTGTERVRHVLVGTRIYVAGFRCITRFTGTLREEVQPVGVVSSVVIDVVRGAQDTLVVSDGSGKVHLSTDSATSWVTRGTVPRYVGAPDVFDIWIDPRQPSRMYALNQDGVQRSTDSGLTWTRGWRGATQWEVGGATPLFPSDRPAETWMSARSFQDAFLVRLSPGGAIEAATFLGGAADDTAAGVALDAAGNLHVAGTTTSLDFPTASAHQPILGGGQDLFVASFTPTIGAVRHATYLGGPLDEDAFAIAVTSAGEAVVAADSAGSAPTHLAAPGLIHATNCGSCGNPQTRQVYLAKFRASGHLRWSGLYEVRNPGQSGVSSSSARAVVARGDTTWVTGFVGGMAFFPRPTILDVIAMRVTDPVCTTSLSPSQATVVAAGGTASATVYVGTGCEWLASVDVPWARITANATGQVGGTIAVTVDANPGGVRRGTLTVGEHTMVLAQAAAGACVTSLSSGPVIATPAFRTTLGAIVMAPAGCAWSATSTVPWIQTTSVGSGQGDLRFTAQSNIAATPRVGVVDLSGFPVTVTQAAGAPDVSMRYLAEGATSSFFDTRLALLNPGDETAVAAVTFQRAAAEPVVTTRTLAPRSRATIAVNALPSMESAEFSILVESTHPLVADRTMSWTRAGGYGAHAETAVASPSATWYLAEGATHSGFELFYLLQNPHPEPADVQIRYLRSDGPALEKTYRLPPASRTTVWVDVEEFDGQFLLAATELSAVISVVAGPPIIVERAMYLSNQGRQFNAGHESAGVTTPATRWFLAEGNTGPYFELFVLLANPTDTDARVRLTYLLPDGTTYTRQTAVAANRRLTVWVDQETPDGTTGLPLADTAVSTTVESIDGVPIIVERAMWWPGASPTWHEAHNSPGSTVTGTMWALAEGEVGTDARRTDTYVLIANTAPLAGSARVTLLFEDGTSAERTFTLSPSSRTNVSMRDDFPEAIGRRFGTVVESIGDSPVAIVVERAMYWDAVGQTWSAGTNALATKLR